MAVNAYLVIDGVQGPSTSKDGAIDLLSFSFGASMPTSASADGGLRAGRADVSHVTVMKVLDKTSPDLFQHCVTGDFLSKVDVIYDKAMGDQQEDYYKLSMSDALITSIQWSGSNENPTESVSFAFKKIQVCYNPEEGGQLKGFVQKGFDTQTIKGF
jgi:type VI secretion system secreted protein Hcp